MKLRRTAYHEAAQAVVAAHFGLVVEQAGVEVAVRGRPLVRATVLAAGGEAERRLTGQEPRGVDPDEVELDRMYLPTTARERASPRRRLWRYTEAVADVTVWVPFWSTHVVRVHCRAVNLIILSA